MRLSNLFVALFASLALHGLTMPARAEALRRLVCPARWPQTAPSAKLVRFVITPGQNRAGGPPPHPNQSEEWDVAAGDEISCAYASGAKLLITIPGLPQHCFTPLNLDEDSSTSKNASCTWFEMGDPSKDAVHIRAMEEPDQSSAFYGVTLGMTKAQVEKSITPPVKPSTEISQRQQQVFVLPNTRQLVVDYDLHGVAAAMEIKPELGKTTGLSQEMIERFGFSDSYWLAGGPMIWKGKNGIRVIVPMQHNFDSSFDMPFPDEDIYVLDTSRFIGLDDILGYQPLP